MTKNYAQIDQDLHVLEFYKDKKGYFLDIGAHDGVSLSNTYLLEREHGWSGVCIEALPHVFAQLIKNRRCICVCCVVFSESDVEQQFVCSDMLSGIVGYLNLDLHPGAMGGQMTVVKTRSVESVLKEVDAPASIDYLSLDTEGTELEILKGIDFDKRVFGMISVEHNYQEDKRSKMKALLRSHGYVYRGDNLFDDDYIHRSAIEGIYFFGNDLGRPITVTIDLESLDVVAESSYWNRITGRLSPKDLTVTFEIGTVGRIFHDSIVFSETDSWKR